MKVIDMHGDIARRVCGLMCFLFKKTILLFIIALIFSVTVTSSNIIPNITGWWKWQGVLSVLVLIYFSFFWYAFIFVISSCRVLSYIFFPLVICSQLLLVISSAKYGTRSAELAISIANTTWQEMIAYFEVENVILTSLILLLLFGVCYLIRCNSPYKYLKGGGICVLCFNLAYTFFSFFALIVYKNLAPDRFRDPDGWMIVFASYHPMAQLTDAIEGLWKYNDLPMLKDPAAEFSNIDSDKVPELVILYIGESFRADHSPLNGYKRNTLPTISSMGNVINMPNVHSKGTQTLTAIQSLLSVTENDSNVPVYKSFINLLNKHGYRSYLLVGANTQGMWYWSPQIAAVLDNKVQLYSKPRNAGEYYNDVQSISNNQNPVFLLIEDGAGHIPYIAENNVFGSASDIDKYDNCIIDIDKRVASVINAIKDKDSVLVFISDHGESFGEGGRFCHSGPLSAKEQTHVSTFIWYSDTFCQKRPEYIANMRRNSSRHINHSFVYHTIISLCGIDAAVQQKEYDLTKNNSALE